MERKINMWERVNIIGFLVVIIFILIAGYLGFFLYFEKFFQIGSFILRFLKAIVAIIFVYVYAKLFLFMITENALTKEQFKKLSKEKEKYKIKIEKKKNKIPLASTAKLRALVKEGNKLNEKYYRGTTFFNFFPGFVLFSIIFGFFYMVSPIWTIKSISSVAKNCTKNKKLGKGCIFGWRKILNLKERNYKYHAFLLTRPKIPSN